MTPEEFKQARLKLGYIQQEMADFLGIKASRSIRRYESGDWVVPKNAVDKINKKKVEESH